MNHKLWYSISDVECMSAPPSALAAASMLLAMKIDGKNWDATLEHYSDYSAKSLSKYAERLRRVSVQNYKLQKKSKEIIEEKGLLLLLFSLRSKQTRRRIINRSENVDCDIRRLHATFRTRFCSHKQFYDKNTAF